jgi:hypothetical protein
LLGVFLPPNALIICIAGLGVTDINILFELIRPKYGFLNVSFVEPFSFRVSLSQSLHVGSIDLPCSFLTIIHPTSETHPHRPLALKTLARCLFQFASQAPPLSLRISRFVSSYTRTGAKGNNADQCELNSRLIQAGHRILSTSTIQKLVKSIEICRFLGRSKGNSSTAGNSSQGSGISVGGRRAQFQHEAQQDDGPRRPAWANWVTSEIIFHGRHFVLPPEPELPFASVSLGPQILDISFVASSSDSKLIAACSSNGSVAILSNGIELVATLTLHQRAATSCDFSPDSTFLVVCSDDCTVSVWSLIDRLTGRISARCIRIIKHNGAARLCQYDPEGISLCTSGSDCVGYMWFTPCWTNEANTPKFSAGDTQPIREHCRETSSCMQMLEGHTGHLTTCCWSCSEARGQVFVTGSVDQTLRIHRKKSVAAMWECTECLKFTASISRCDFDISGFTLVLSFHFQKSHLAYDMKSKRTTVIGTGELCNPK